MPIRCARSSEPSIRAICPVICARAKNIDMRGSMARLHLLVDRLPQYTGLSAGEGPQHRGFTLLGGTVEEYERCWEAQQRGELVDDYPIELTIQSVTDPTLAAPGLHTITTGIQQLPFDLAHGDWDTRREEFTDRVVRSPEAVRPRDRVVDPGLVHLTPLDLRTRVRAHRRKHLPRRDDGQPAVRLSPDTRWRRVSDPHRRVLPVWRGNASRRRRHGGGGTQRRQGDPAGFQRRTRAGAHGSTRGPSRPRRQPRQLITPP